MTEVPDVALSTLALSAYNLLADVGELDVEQLRKLLHGVGFPCSRKRLVAAISGLMRRGRAELNGDRVRITDPLRRRVVGRDRSGNGWGAWLAQNQNGPSLLDAVTE